MDDKTGILVRRVDPQFGSCAAPRVLIGALPWTAALAALRPGWPEAMLLLAIWVVVPVGMGLIAPVDTGDRLAKPWKWATRLQLPAAMALTASFLLPAGGPAAVLALPWLLVCALAALHGLTRVVRGPRTVAEVCLSAGPIYLAVGGTWTVISRSGKHPLGFPDVIVAMTAVHFHYAGFALPVLSGLVARALGGPSARAACLGVIAGVPLVAVGITDAQLGSGILPLPTRSIELAATAVTAASGILVGLLQVQLAARPDAPPIFRVLMTVSGLALPVPMALAVLYALGAFRHVVWIDIAGMFRYHGAVNALGFALPGLLAWHLQPSLGKVTATRYLGDRPSIT